MTDLLSAELEKHRGLVPFGNTPTGSAWASKALHPAAGHTGAGIPDGQSRATAKLATTTTHIVSHPAGSGETWDTDLVFFCHPLCFGYEHSVYGAGDRQSNFWNPTFYGDGDPTLIWDRYMVGTEKFLEMAERYRPTYYSVTLTPVCSSTTNQGTIIAAQYPQDCRMYNTQVTYVVADGKGKTRAESPAPEHPRRGLFANRSALMADVEKRGGPDALNHSSPVNGYDYRRTTQIEGWPQYYNDLNALTILPSAYSAAFADGVYAPYKFTPDSRLWKNSKDVHDYSSAADLAEFELHPTTTTAAITPACTLGYPYVMQGVTGGNGNGNPTIPRGDHNVIHIAIRGMSAAASFRLTIRAGWELETLPGSSIAPFTDGPIEPDPAALLAYSLIVRKLADAYPEKYNSWEQLISVIEKAADAAGVVIPGAQLIGKGARFLYDTFKKKQPAHERSTTARRQPRAPEREASTSRKPHQSKQKPKSERKRSQSAKPARK